ncbi:DNA-binding response regulator [Pseudomonas syringae pv. actinidiae]|uniref:DNA-binding response regulator n=1 Tax=Pseudomonas syringae pv. actinidiae TaxID=103796 RepID=A0A2V0Q9C4_PSESF|nr:DNA-binding response regulator [Pseudomonas syringae pv. actinidiae]
MEHVFVPAQLALYYLVSPVRIEFYQGMFLQFIFLVKLNGYYRMVMSLSIFSPQPNLILSHHPPRSQVNAPVPDSRVGVSLH